MSGSDLGAIEAIADQKQKTELYKNALQQIVASCSVESCNAFVDHMLTDGVPLVISRQLLQLFATEITKLPAETLKPVATHALEKVQPRVVSFDETVTLIRENLATLLETEEQWSQAAQVLAGIDLDTGSRGVDATYRLSKSVKIAMLFLEDDDPVSAEMYIKKASSVLSACKDDDPVSAEIYIKKASSVVSAFKDDDPVSAEMYIKKASIVLSACKDDDPVSAEMYIKKASSVVSAFKDDDPVSAELYIKKASSVVSA
eukprot:gene1710-33116_t